MIATCIPVTLEMSATQVKLAIADRHHLMLKRPYTILAMTNSNPCTTASTEMDLEHEEVSHAAAVDTATADEAEMPLISTKVVSPRLFVVVDATQVVCITLQIDRLGIA